MLTLLKQPLDKDKVLEIRSLVIDFFVSIQEVQLVDSKASQSSSKDSNDEMGYLLELVTGAYDLVSC